MRKRIFLATFVLAAVATSMLLYRAHHRVVTSGSFSGSEIGLSKEDVLSIILERTDVSAIQVRVPSFRVSSKNLGEIDRLHEVSAFLIQSPKLQVTVFNDHGTITWYRHQGVGTQMRRRPQEIGDLVPILRDFLAETPEASVIAIPRGLGMTVNSQLPLQNGKPPDAETLSWLFSYDLWAFVEDDRWTSYELSFSGGKLTRIEFRNNFAELP